MSNKDPVQTPFSPAGPQSGPVKSAGRRPRARAFILVGAIAGLAVVALVYTVFERQEAMQRKADAAAQKEELGGAGALPPSGIFQKIPQAPAPVQPAAPPAAPAPAPPDRPSRSSRSDQRREREKEKALASSPVVRGFGGAGQAARQMVQHDMTSRASIPPVVPSLQTEPAMPSGGGPFGQDQSGQSEKAGFLNRTPETDTYLNARRTAPKSETEIKAGTVIPAVMVGGINSDLPGEIVGEVSRNVYDTATGRFLLIPAGAKVIGTYDSQVSHGQSRVLVAWQRIIFPDGSSISLGGMPGTDAAGYTGFHDKVNRHFWRLFGDALFMSVLSAGAQISQGQTSGTTLSNSQLAAASLGQQFSQVGEQVVQRNMNIPPSLEIRPGYQFNVMITKDVILSPWRR